MKLLKLLLIRNISKSMAFSFNPAGEELLTTLYEEVLGKENAEFIKEETNEMGFKTNG